MNRRRSSLTVGTGALTLVLGLTAAPGARQVPSEPPLGLDLYVPAPDDNRPTPDRVALGERLFFDTRLSADRSLSCASCHQPARAFTDGRPVGRGVGGRPTTRSVPSILNAGYGASFFWDGRISTLEAQVLAPVVAPDEMGADLEEVVARVDAEAGYRDAFAAAYGTAVSRDALARALAAFVRSRRSGNSAYDRFVAGNPEALPAEARAGLRLFQGEARCVECHTGPLLTDGRLHNTGVAWGGADAGRAGVTGLGQDRGRFKTPSLRNVDLTAPYMHDGRLATLDEVVDFYARGGTPNPNLDPRITPLDLTSDERRHLVAFLRALTSAEYEPAAGRPSVSEATRPILFDSDRTGRHEIFAIDPATGEPPRQLTSPATAGGESSFPQVYVMTADGRAVTRLTNTTGTSGGPAWSPDGQWLAFQSDHDANTDSSCRWSSARSPRRTTTSGRSSARGSCLTPASPTSAASSPTMAAVSSS